MVFRRSVETNVLWSVLCSESLVLLHVTELIFLNIPKHPTGFEVFSVHCGPCGIYVLVIQKRVIVLD